MRRSSLVVVVVGNLLQGNCWRSWMVSGFPDFLMFCFLDLLSSSFLHFATSWFTDFLTPGYRNTKSQTLRLALGKSGRVLKLGLFFVVMYASIFQHVLSQHESFATRPIAVLLATLQARRHASDQFLIVAILLPNLRHCVGVQDLGGTLAILRAAQHLIVLKVFKLSDG